MNRLRVPRQRGKRRPDGVPDRRPDMIVPAFVGAFGLGVVVAAVTLLAVQSGRGDTVPAGVHQQVARELAGAQAAAAARQAALEDADALARRLVAALDSPTPVPPAERAELREQVAAQTRVIERVRVVRVPGPTVTVAPPPVRPQPAARQPARQQPAQPSPAASTPTCTVAVLSACLIR